jgi:hypothetical protein
MGSTGHRSDRSGIYRSTCCGYEIALSVGEKFPPCRQCRHAVQWRLVRPTNR